MAKSSVRAALTCLILALCVGCGGSKEPEVTDAELATVRHHIESIDHVTSIDIRFADRAFGHGSSWRGVVYTDSKEPEVVVDVLDQAYKTLWHDTSVPVGQIIITAWSSDKSVSAPPLYPEGFNGHPSLADLQEVYGPR